MSIEPLSEKGFDCDVCNNAFSEESIKATVKAFKEAVNFNSVARDEFIKLSILFQLLEDYFGSLADDI